MERNNLVIAISGKMRHGKDTIGDYLIAKYGFKPLRFADKVKEVCINYDNSTPELRESWNKKVAQEVLSNVSRDKEVDVLMQSVCPGIWKKLTHEECYGEKTKHSRLTMQGFAQGMRNLDPDCWVRYALSKSCEKKGRWVITDIRYRNEAFAIEGSENSQIWRVIRPMGPQPGGDHVSEVELDDYPFEVYIDNDGTIESLHRKVDKIIRPILKGMRPFAKGGEVY